MHASSVGLIRNLRTNNISPQFHIIYDSHFETVHSNDATPPAVWDELIVFNRDMANFEEDQYVPELSDEWLSTEEVVNRARLKNDPKKVRKEGPSDINSEEKLEMIPLENDMVKSSEPKEDIIVPQEKESNSEKKVENAIKPST